VSREAESAGDGEQRFSRLFSIYTHEPGLTVGLVSFLHHVFPRPTRRYDRPMRARRTATLLTTAMLVGCASGTGAGREPAPEPPRVDAPAPQPPSDRKLLPFLGSWTVEAVFIPADGAERTTLTGRAEILPAIDGRSVRETLVLEDAREGAERDRYRLETTLGYSRARGRYELTQYDDLFSGAYWMVGLWGPGGRRLELSPVDLSQVRGQGFEDMRWLYEFDDRGRLVKTVRVSDGDGVWRTHSVYTYTRDLGGSAPGAGPSIPGVQPPGFSGSSSSGVASSTVYPPTAVRRSPTSVPPVPSAPPRSRASERM